PYVSLSSPWATFFICSHMSFGVLLAFELPPTARLPSFSMLPAITCLQEAERWTTSYCFLSPSFSSSTFVPLLLPILIFILTFIIIIIIIINLITIYFFIYFFIVSSNSPILFFFFFFFQYLKNLSKIPKVFEKLLKNYHIFKKNIGNLMV